MKDYWGLDLNIDTMIFFPSLGKPVKLVKEITNETKFLNIEKAFKSLGISAKDAENKVRPFSDVLSKASNIWNKKLNKKGDE